MATGVSIVIPSWNGLELLKRFLPSVIAAANQYSTQFDAPTEIIVVDDASTDATAQALLALGFEGEQRREIDDEELILSLIVNKTNLGFGPTCNRGIDAASHPLVFLVNNDVDVEVNSIAPLVENFADAAVFAAHSRVFDLESGLEVGTGKLGTFSRGFIRVHRSYVLPQPAADLEGSERYSMFASGGSSMFDRQKFLDIGGFDELLAPSYWEDVDISYRAWKRGLSIVYEPRSAVRHRVSSTMRKVNQRKLRRLQQRNRLIYHWVNLHDGWLFASHIVWVALLSLSAPLRLQLGFLSSVFAALKRLSLIRKRRIEEKHAARRSDREVFEIFKLLERRTNVLAYDDRAFTPREPLP